MKKKSCTRAWCGVLAAALVVTSTSSVMLAEAAKAPKLNKKTITLRAGAKKQLKVKNLKKKQSERVAFFIISGSDDPLPNPQSQIKLCKE